MTVSCAYGMLLEAFPWVCSDEHGGAVDQGPDKLSNLTKVMQLLSRGAHVSGTKACAKPSCTRWRSALKELELGRKELQVPGVVISKEVSDSVDHPLLESSFLHSYPGY